MLLPHKRTFPTPTLTQKLFSNMKRASEEYSGVDIPLFPTMLTAPESSPSRITSSPFLSPQTHSSTSQPPSTPPSIQPTPVTEEAALMPHESPLQTEEDPSNQGRSLIEELDLDTGISLVPPHAADQGRFDDTQISDQSEEQLEVFSAATALTDAARRRRSVENVQTYIRRRREVSTGSGGVSTASRLVSTADISTASELDSTAGVKAKDKGKAIMHESEPPKKIKKRVQVQMSVDEELAKKVFEEEQARFNAKQEAREEVVAQAHDIDWSDPAVLRYHTLQNRPFSVAEVRKNMCMYLKNQGGYKLSHFKGMSYEDIRPIFERVWDQNQAFVPKDSEIEKEVMKRSGFDLQQEFVKKDEASSFAQKQPARGSRKKSLARKRARETLSEESAKKQKLEDDTEKEELQVYLNIVPEEESLNIESLATKYPIVDWETQILANDKYYYQIKRADGSVKHYKIFSAMLYDFDRQDTMIEPNEEDEIWRNQQDWNLINWKLHNFCGVYVLLLDTGLVIHMMVENKYPLSQDILSKMLSRKLEVDNQSDMDYELIRIISLRREIKPRNPQHVTKNCETCGSNVHTTSNHNDIEWFRKREALQAKKVESFKATMFSAKAKDIVVVECCANIPWIKSQLTDYGDIEFHFIPTQYQLADIFIKLLDKPSFKRLIDELANALENSKVSFSISTGGISGEVGVNTFRNAIGAHYLPHSSEYVAPPSIDVTLYPTQFFIPRAQPRQKKHSTSSKQPYMSNKEATKGGSSKAPTSSKTIHSKKRKESSSAMDSNPSQPLVSTPVDTGMHKEDQQATASFIIHSKSASGVDASVVSTAEVDPGKSSSSNFIPQQQGMNEGTKNTSYDHLFVGTDPHVLGDKTQSVEEDEASRTIKLEDLVKLVSSVQPSFKDLDSPEDDPIIIVDDSDEDKEAEEVHATTNVETKDTSHKLELEKNKAEAEAALLKAQPSFPNVGHVNELLVKSLQTEFSKILFAHDFSSLLPTKLKDLPSKFNKLTKEVKGLKKKVHELEIELPGDLKEIPSNLEDFTKIVISLTSQVVKLKTFQWELSVEFLSVPSQVKMVQAKLKTLDALPSLFNKVTNALKQFA
ncbi:hypothetical protein Tco_0870239 [Tanacetum coccineum]